MSSFVSTTRLDQIFWHPLTVLQGRRRECSLQWEPWGTEGGINLHMPITNLLSTPHLRALAALEDYDTHIIMVNSLYEEPDRCVFADHALSVTTIKG